MRPTRLRPVLAAAATLVACASFVACAPTPTMRADSGTGGGGAGGDAPPSVTYTTNVQPILAAKCQPCHTTGGLGGHNIGTTYADVHHEVESLDSFGCWDGPNMDTLPKKVGECALVLIKNGRMPQSSGCGLTEPPDPSLCVPPGDQAVIEAWIAAGMPQ